MFKKRFSIDSEIYIIFIIAVNITVFNALFGFINMHNNRELNRKVLNINLPSLEALEKMNLQATRSNLLITNWVYMPDDVASKEALLHHQSEEYPELKGNTLALITMWEDTVNVLRMDTVFAEFEQLLSAERKIVKALYTDKDYRDTAKNAYASEILETEVQDQYNDIITKLNEVIADKRLQTQKLDENLEASSTKMIFTLSLMGVLIIGVMLFVIVYMTRHMIRPMQKLKNYIMHMSRGEIPHVDLEIKKNAVGQMADAVKILADGMNRTAKFAAEIGKQNFDMEYEPLSDHDEFSSALLQMRESLRKASDENEKYILEIEKINKQLDEFVYIVSHDLKAPLRGISTLTTFIEDELASQPNEKIKELLVLMKSRTNRLQNLITAVLEYSRLSATKGAKENVNVSELLDNILDLIAPPQNFRVIKEGNFPTLFTERIKLQQVLQNLISNGIKHNDKTSGLVSISSFENGRYVRFDIKDNGMGIGKEYHEKIFGVFQTLESKDKNDSTGIGLTIVKKLIEQQGGSITIDSELGKGSCFSFTWPKN
jgi:signal transduction histidine kinase